MSLKVASVIDRNIFIRPLLPIIVAADTTVTVFDDITRKGDFDQIVTREVQNVGATDMYYSYGEDCKPPLGNSPGVFNGLIPVKQMLVVETLQKFTVYAVGGATIAARTEIKRDDRVQPSGVLTDNLQ